MKKLFRVLSLILLVFGLPSCKFLECLGDGPTTYSKVELIVQTPEIVAGGNPISVQANGQIHCHGQTSGFEQFEWSLEPPVGKIIIATNDPTVITYQPPATIDASMNVKIVMSFFDNGVKKTDVTIRVLKP